MNNWSSSTVKQEWNHSVFVLLILFGFVINTNDSLPLGLKQPSSPSTKELHAQLIEIFQISCILPFTRVRRILTHWGIVY